MKAPSVEVSLAISDYYHRARNHLGLGKDSPEPRPIQAPEIGPVVAIPQVEGVGWTIFVWARIVVCITAFASGTGSVMQLKK